MGSLVSSPGSDPGNTSGSVKGTCLKNSWADYRPRGDSDRPVYLERAASDSNTSNSITRAKTGWWNKCPMIHVYKRSHNASVYQSVQSQYFGPFLWKSNLESITVGCHGYKYKSYVRPLICEDHVYTLLLIERQSVGRIKLNYERPVFEQRLCGCILPKECMCTKCTPGHVILTSWYIS
jgi:hypothetical protein